MRAGGAQDVLIGAGRRLHVRRWEGSGRPLVLLHGLLDDSEGWAGLAADTHRPCLAVDLPGFGGSDLPREPRISSYADDVAAGLRRLGISDCTLVGHSLGGAVAAAVAERASAVASLALLAPAGFGRIRIAEAVTLPGVVDVAELALPLALLNPLVCVAAYSTFISHRRLPSQDLLARLRRRAFHSAPGVRAAAQAIAHAGRDRGGFARRPIAFDGPVAALWGEHDALVSRGHIAALRSALPQAHVEVWPGMGHHPQRERPAELARFIEVRAGRARRMARRRRSDARRAASICRPMRLASFGVPGDERVRAGEVRGEEVIAFGDGSSVLDRLASGDRSPAAGESFALHSVTLLAPVARPRAIFGIGLNYADHAAETGRDAPEAPIVFLKLPASSAPPNATVHAPAAAAHRLDYEGELAVVMGAGGVVAGYAIADDLSARDLQGREPQWTRAKGFDDSCPWGPWVTTADEVADPHALGLRTWVNGDLRQDSTTADLIFGVPQLVDFLAETCTLEPGDLILTGTPSGVGVAMDPRGFLAPGDVVRIEIDGLGAVEHAIGAPRA